MIGFERVDKSGEKKRVVVVLWLGFRGGLFENL